MFLRRRGIQPDAIQNMHLHDVLLEIMAAVDPRYNEEEGTSPQQTGTSMNGGTIIQPKPGQTTAAAMKEMKEAGLL